MDIFLPHWAGFEIGGLRTGGKGSMRFALRINGPSNV
jgi:hypothetical protein